MLNKYIDSSMGWPGNSLAASMGGEEFALIWMVQRFCCASFLRGLLLTHSGTMSLSLCRTSFALLLFLPLLSCACMVEVHLLMEWSCCDCLLVSSLEFSNWGTSTIVVITRRRDNASKGQCAATTYLWVVCFRHTFIQVWPFVTASVQASARKGPSQATFSFEELLEGEAGTNSVIFPLLGYLFSLSK